MRKRILIIVVLALLVSLMCLPVTAIAGESPQHHPVSGVWTWCCNAENPDHVPGKEAGPNYFLWGHEHGTWAGTFVGTSYEPYYGVIHPTGMLWALISIEFTGTVEGVAGAFVMRVTVWSPPPGDTMFGRWTIVSGSGGLRNLHGQGTWVFTTCNDTECWADYEGEYWLLH